MQFLLTAMGGGSPETMTLECADALKRASVLIGAKRLLEGIPSPARKIAAISPKEIAALAASLREEDGLCAVVYSGDTGFYSGARGLLPLLKEEGIEAKVLPGISSVQLLAARLGRPWQDWKLTSAHGIDCDPVAEISCGKPVFFLTGGSLTPSSLCGMLYEAGLGDLPAVVGENLSYPDERLVQGTVSELAAQQFASLSVLLVEAAPRFPARTPGLPDEAFLRGKVPMTKQEVRTAALGKLAAAPGDVAWDVGAGTGSVSVELALSCPRGRVYAVECEEEACGLILQNKEKFSAWNLHLVKGRAPEALEQLPPPDVVFIGGTKGGMDAIVELVLRKNPNARICISAIALETLSAAAAALTARGMEAQISQIAVSRAKPAGSLHLLMANNPVFLITGNCL